MHTQAVTYMDSSGILLCAILNSRDCQESNNLGFPMVLLTDNDSKVQSCRVGIRFMKSSGSGLERWFNQQNACCVSI